MRWQLIPPFLVVTRHACPDFCCTRASGSCTIHRALKFIHRKNSWNLKKNHLFEKHFKPLFKISIFLGGSFMVLFVGIRGRQMMRRRCWRPSKLDLNYWGWILTLEVFTEQELPVLNGENMGKKRAISLFLLLFLFCLEWILQQNLMICAVHYMVANWLLGIPVSVREFDGIGFFAPGIGSEIKFPMFPYVS